MLLYIICILTASKLSPQFGKIEGRVNFVYDTVSRQGVEVMLNMRDSVVYRTYANEQGYFHFDSVQTGTYSLSIKQIGYRIVTVNEILVNEYAPVKVTVQFPHPLPCPYNYAKDSKPMCIKGHTDNIIPIVYGLPGKKLMKKARKGRIYLGGCSVSDCDPMFYCAIHKMEF